MDTAATPELVTYEYLGHTFQMPDTASYEDCAEAAIRQAFPQHPEAYPVFIPARDGGGFRVYEPVEEGCGSSKLHGAEGLCGRRTDGSLFWPERAGR